MELDDERLSHSWWAYYRMAMTLPLMRAVGEEDDSTWRLWSAELGGGGRRQVREADETP